MDILRHINYQLPFRFIIINVVRNLPFSFVLVFLYFHIVVLFLKHFYRSSLHLSMCLFFYSILITVAVFITAIFYANKKAIDASLKWQRKQQSSNTWFCIIKIKMHLSNASIHLSLNKSISPMYHFVGYTKCSYTMHITFYTNSCWYFNWISFCIYDSNKWHARRKE